MPTLPGGSKVENIRLSVLVVNYNGLHVVPECLRSLKPLISEYDEVIVVDNASSDGSAELIAADFPWVKLHHSAQNLGFTGGNNLAAEHARGEFLLLLNNDATIDAGLEEALRHFDDPQLGVIGANIHYPSGERQFSIGLEHTPLRIFLSWLGRRFMRGTFSRTLDVAEAYESDASDLCWVSGAALLTRRSLWCAVGGLDERYFMYMEDVDYCRTVRDRAMRIDYCRAFEVTHHEAGGRRWVGERALMNTATSYVHFLHKFYSRRKALTTLYALAGLFTLRSLLYRMMSLFRADDLMDEKYRAYARAALVLAKRNRHADANGH